MDVHGGQVEISHLENRTERHDRHLSIVEKIIKQKFNQIMFLKIT